MNKNELEIAHGLSIDVKVSQNDIVNVAVADQEAELTEKANFLKKEINGLRKTIKEKSIVMEKKISNIAESFQSKEVSSMTSLVGKLGIVVICVHHIMNREKMFKDKKIELSLSMSQKEQVDKSYYSHSSSMSGKRSKVAIPKEITDIHKEINALNDRVSELAENRIAVTAELRNIPSLERQVKAKISRSVLQKHEGGREFLKKIKGTKALLLK